MTGTALADRVVRSGFGVGYLFLGLVRVYRLTLSRALPRACRFEPSCSAYAEEALARHGLFHAAWLIVRRVARCHPFHRGGYDPVP
jgi:putative membrane protein insertion efficiency factor